MATNAANELPAPAHVRAIAPYQAGKPIDELAREFGLDPATIVKLASNENPLGMPESARKAMVAAMEDLGRYPDSNGFALKAALAAKFGVPLDWITLGNGSNDILELAAAAVAGDGPQLHLCAAFVRRLCARDPGAWRPRDRRTRPRARPRPGRDGERGVARYGAHLRRQSEQPDRHLSSGPCGRGVPAARACAGGRRARRGLQRIPAAGTADRLGRVDAASSEPAAVAHLLQGVRTCRTARRLRHRAARADRPAEPGAPALQRERRGAGRGGRCARRRGLPRAQLHPEPRAECSS